MTFRGSLVYSEKGREISAKLAAIPAPPMVALLSRRSWRPA